MGKESKIEQALRNEVIKLGGLCLKFKTGQFSGVPDRIILLKGKVWFVELKAPDGVLSHRQQYVRDYEFRPRGIEIVYIYDMNQLQKFKHDLQGA
jgi:hypothetical protein